MARLQEQYIAILGHDIRTPLSSIQIGISFLDDLIKDSEVASTVQVPVFKAVSRMKNSVQRISRLIEDTMDFTHTRVGQGLPVKLAVSNNLSQQINYTVEELATAFPKSSIRIHVDITRPLICDDKRICQLLSNLLKNALIHGDLSYPVYVKVLTNSNDFILSVQNSGTPISDDSKARLFQPFWRKESNRQNEGLGLGGGTFGGMMSARGSANLLSRLTALTATLFMVMSIILTITASVGSDKNVLESLPSMNEEESIPSEPSIPE